MADPRRARDRASVLAVARVGEQVALAGALLILARRLSVTDFGVVSLVFAFQTLSVTASDYGVGLALLRTPPDVAVARAPLDRCRRRNAAIATVGAILAGVLGATDHSRTAVLALLGGLIWATSAEAYIRKAAALRLDEARRVAVSEVGGSALLLAIVLVVGRGDAAPAVVAGAFVAKSAVELLASSTSVRRSFTAVGVDPSPGWVWGSQVLSFAIANIDYVVVQLVLGSRALGLYSLAFRIAGLLPSQVSFVVSRVATVDLARRPPDERPEATRALLRTLFLAGVGVAAVGLAVAPFVGDALGHKWDDAEPLVALLAVCAPWRLILPVAGISALVRDRARDLSWFEGARFVLVVTLLTVGAAVNLVWCATLASVALVIGAASAHVLPPLRIALRPSRVLVAVSAAAVAGLLAAGAMVA